MKWEKTWNHMQSQPGKTSGQMLHIKESIQYMKGRHSFQMLSFLHHACHVKSFVDSDSYCGNDPFSLCPMRIGGCNLFSTKIIAGGSGGLMITSKYEYVAQHRQTGLLI